MSILNTINPSIFTTSVQELVEEKNRFLRIGALRRSADLDQFLKDGDSTSFGEIPVKLIRTQQWSLQKLSGSNSTDAIVDRVANYEGRRLDMLILSVLAGISANNNDLTFDVSGVNFDMGVTNLSVNNVVNAKQTLEGLSVIAVHSAVYSRLRKNGLIEGADSSTPTFEGMPIIWDDGMPKIGNVFDSYLFGFGALEFGRGEHPRGTEITPTTVTDTEVTEDILSRTWVFSVHPRGYNYVGPSTQGGPTNPTLALASSWERKCQRSDIKILRLRTREA